MRRIWIFILTLFAISCSATANAVQSKSLAPIVNLLLEGKATEIDCDGVYSGTILPVNGVDCCWNGASITLDVTGSVIKATIASSESGTSTIDGQGNFLILTDGIVPHVVGGKLLSTCSIDEGKVGEKYFYDLNGSFNCLAGKAIFTAVK